MAVYKFRIKFEDYDDVTRDIEIKPTQTFKDLHLSIQQAIKFDASKPANFFMSNDQWVKGKEISLEPKKNKDGSDVTLMETAVLNKFIIDPHQKIYYIFDNWTFFIELFKIVLDADKKAIYPRCVKVVGEAPPQYKKIILPAAEESEEEVLLLDELDDDAEIAGSADEVFDDEHGFESEEGNDDDKEEVEDEGEAFNDEE